MSKVKEVVNMTTNKWFLYGSVGEGELTAKAMQDWIKKLESSEYESGVLYINSYGGQVSEGLSMYHSLKHSEKPVKVVIEGIAASIASVIAMGGDEVEIYPYGLLMVHDPLVTTGGNSKTLRDSAEKLEMVASSIAGIYQERTHLEAEVLRRYMDKETWFTAQEAVEQGFCDAVLYPDQDAAVAAEIIFNRFSGICEERLGQEKTNLLNENAQLKAKLAEKAAELEAMRTIGAERIVDNAIADGTVHPRTRNIWLKLFLDDPKESQELLDAMPRKGKSVMDTLKSEAEGKSEWDIRNWEQEDPTGLLKMRREDPERYGQLYEEFYS